MGVLTFLSQAMVVPEAFVRSASCRFLANGAAALSLKGGE